MVISLLEGGRAVSADPADVLCGVWCLRFMGFVHLISEYVVQFDDYSVFGNT